jgi:hypothetical protein
VIAVDPYGNTDTHYQGTVTFGTSDGDPGVVLPPDYTFQPADGGMVTFPGGATLITPGDQTLTATDTTSGITGAATVTVTAGPAPGAGGSGADPAVVRRGWPTAAAAVAQGPRSTHTPAGAAVLSAASAEGERLPFRARSLAARAHRAALIDHAWGDPDDPLLSGLGLDGLVLNEGR